MIKICFGTRPEYLKIKPLINAFKRYGIKFDTIFTGQHDTIFGKEYQTLSNKNSMKEYNPQNRLLNIGANLFCLDESIFNNVEYILVQGDTASSYFMALNAFFRGIKVIHVEAGLRTNDVQNPYPEEFYRSSISKIANIHFCPTTTNEQNLKEEGITKNVHVVGNTIIDHLKQTIEENNIQITYSNVVLITLHRRENRSIMKELFSKISHISCNFPSLKFVIPLHPSTIEYKQYLYNIDIIEPLEYVEFIRLMASCRFIISDSGGIQEEANYLGKKVIVCRNVTERPESLGITSFLYGGVDNLIKNVKKVNKEHKPKSSDCLYGDGNASEKIAKILTQSKII